MRDSNAFVIHQKDYLLQEWKNGKGKTAEISVFPSRPSGLEGKGNDVGSFTLMQGISPKDIGHPTSRNEASFSDESFLWRLSSAKIENSGPFSEFPGYDRYLTLVEGRVLLFKLGVHEEERLIKLGEVVQFSGDDTASCEVISEPVTDFNLIYRRGQVQAHFETIRISKKPRSFEMSGKAAFFFPISNPISATLYPGEKRIQVLPGDTLQLNLEAEDHATQPLILLDAGNLECHGILIELNWSSLL